MTRHVYDAAGQRVEHYEAYGRNGADGRGTERHSISVFDGAGHLVQQTAADGSVIRQEYDAVGNLVRRIDAAGSPDERVAVYDYDRNNRLLTQVVAPGTGDALVTRYKYDAFGNRIEMTVGDRFLSGDDDFNVFDIPYERSQR